MAINYNYMNPYYGANYPSAGSIIWVQSKAGAEAYPVAPGNKVMLMDSKDPIVYVKSADMTGRPMPLVIYDLIERKESEETKTVPIPVVPEIDYDKIKQLINEEVTAQMSNLTLSNKTKKGSK